MLRVRPMITITDIYAALVAERGHRGRAAERLGMPRRTLYHRLSEADAGPRLEALAREHGWPSSTAAATSAASVRAAEKRAERTAGA